MLNIQDWSIEIQLILISDTMTYQQGTALTMMLHYLWLTCIFILVKRLSAGSYSSVQNNISVTAGICHLIHKVNKYSFIVLQNHQGLPCWDIYINQSCIIDLRTNLSFQLVPVFWGSACRFGRCLYTETKYKERITHWDDKIWSVFVTWSET